MMTKRRIQTLSHIDNQLLVLTVLTSCQINQYVPETRISNNSDLDFFKKKDILVDFQNI